MNKGLLEVTISFDPPTGAAEVILGQAMNAVAPAVRLVTGQHPPVVRAETGVSVHQPVAVQPAADLRLRVAVAAHRSS